MRVIVTRPACDAHRWVGDLLVVGLKAVALPLIKIGPVDDPAAMVSAWQRLGDYVGVMFVSGNAVDHFFRSKPPLAYVFIDVLQSKTRAWAPGPGTADALLRWGVLPDRIDTPALKAGQFDSEALWQVVAPQVHPSDRVLIVRGGDSASVSSGRAGLGRDWLAQQLAGCGAEFDFVVAYQRSAPDLSASEVSLARAAASDGSVWLLSSSEAIANLIALIPGQSWAGARALVTHPRIARAASVAGFGEVQESRPLFSEVVVSLQRMAQLAQ